MSTCVWRCSTTKCSGSMLCECEREREREKARERDTVYVNMRVEMFNDKVQWINALWGKTKRSEAQPMTGARDAALLKSEVEKPHTVCRPTAQIKQGAKYANAHS